MEADKLTKRFPRLSFLGAKMGGMVGRRCNEVAFIVGTDDPLLEPMIWKERSGTDRRTD